MKARDWPKTLILPQAHDPIRDVVQNQVIGLTIAQNYNQHSMSGWLRWRSVEFTNQQICRIERPAQAIQGCCLCERKVLTIATTLQKLYRGCPLIGLRPRSVIFYIGRCGINSIVDGPNKFEQAQIFPHCGQIKSELNHARMFGSHQVFRESFCTIPPVPIACL